MDIDIIENLSELNFRFSNSDFQSEIILDSHHILKNIFYPEFKKNNFHINLHPTIIQNDNNTFKGIILSNILANSVKKILIVGDTLISKKNNNNSFSPSWSGELFLVFDDDYQKLKLYYELENSNKPNNFWNNAILNKTGLTLIKQYHSHCIKFIQKSLLYQQIYIPKPNLINLEDIPLDVFEISDDDIDINNDIIPLDIKKSIIKKHDIPIKKIIVLGKNDNYKTHLYIKTLKKFFINHIILKQKYFENSGQNSVNEIWKKNGKTMMFLLDNTFYKST